VGGKRPYSEEEGETADRVTRQEILAAYPFHTPLRGKENQFFNSMNKGLILAFFFFERSGGSVTGGCQNALKGGRFPRTNPEIQVKLGPLKLKGRMYFTPKSSISAIPILNFLFLFPF